MLILTFCEVGLFIYFWAAPHGMQDPNSPGIEPTPPPPVVEVWMAREFLVHFMYEVLKLREIKMMWSRLNEQIRGGGRIQSWICFSPET